MSSHSTNGNGLQASAKSSVTRIGLLTLNQDGRITLFNKAAEQILGLSVRDVKGRPCKEIFSGLPNLATGINPRSTKIWNKSLKVNARHKDGRVIPLIATPYIIKSSAPPKGRLSDKAISQTDCRVIIVFQDAQEQEKMEMQLQHVDRLHSLDEFAAGIVHEIRNPLAGIMINAQHVSEEIGQHCRKLCTRIGRAGLFHEEIQDIIADVRSIENIVKKVLDFAHPNKLQIKNVFLEDMVKEILKFSKVLLRHQNVRLKTNFSSPEKVHVDVSGMKQVFFNLVRNACEAMPDGGELCVRNVKQPMDNGYVCIEMEDTGTGISKENIKRIFDPFFSMHHKGTGLGLTISRKIIEDHGGRIEVSSKPGKGTTFRIILPTA